MVSGKPHLMADLCASENPRKVYHHFVSSSPWLFTSHNRGSEPKSVNCHSNDNAHQGFLDRKIFKGTLEQEFIRQQVLIFWVNCWHSKKYVTHFNVHKTFPHNSFKLKTCIEIWETRQSTLINYWDCLIIGCLLYLAPQIQRWSGWLQGLRQTLASFWWGLSRRDSPRAADLCRKYLQQPWRGPRPVKGKYEQNHRAAIEQS